MSRKIFPLSLETIWPMGLGLLAMQQPFLELLRKAAPTNFGSQLLSELGGFVFMLLFMVPLFLWLTAKMQHLEFLRKGYEERRRIGYGRYFLCIWLLALKVDLLSFIGMKLIFSYTLSYGQVLVVAVVAATCAALFQLLYIAFLDSWVRGAVSS